MIRTSVIRWVSVTTGTFCLLLTIEHWTVVCLVAWPLAGSPCNPRACLHLRRKIPRRTRMSTCVNKHMRLPTSLFEPIRWFIYQRVPRLTLTFISWSSVKSWDVTKTSIWALFPPQMISWPSTGLVNVAHWNSREKRTPARWYEILVLFEAQCTLIKSGAVHSG